DDALINGAVGEIKLAGVVNQHGAVAGGAGVGQHVGVQHQRGNGLDGAVVAEVAVGQIGQRAGANRRDQLAVVGDDALINGAVGEIELAGVVNQHGAVAGGAGVGQHVGVQHQRGNGLDGAVVGEVAVGQIGQRAGANRRDQLAVVGDDALINGAV